MVSLMVGQRQYFNEILTLLGEDRRKLPALVVLFLGASMLDLAGLGLIAPYIALVTQPDSMTQGRLSELLALLKSLADQIKLGAFREDLYYRINVIPIILPPLRDRKDDLPALVNHFMAKNAPNDNSSRIEQVALNYIKNYDWPGNVRELRNLIERIAILAPDTPEKVSNVIKESLKVQSLSLIHI